MSLKSKPCNHPNCNYPRWSKGYCKYHQEGKKEGGLKKTPFQPPKQKKPLNKVSKKLSAQLKLYNAKKTLYMSEHTQCEVIGCQNPSTDLHHKKGRGENLLKHFMAVCRDCHNHIHDNPKWSYDNGYMIKRISNNN